MNDQDFALVISDDDTFSDFDAGRVVEAYVCAACWGPLSALYIPNDHRVLVVCQEHGNVCNCGRVTNATVSIEMERSYKRFHTAIRALPDLWGHLIEEGFDRDRAFKYIIRSCVCRVCGATLGGYLRSNDKNIDIHCPSHGNVNECGYIEKKDFVFDQRRIKAWEHDHKRR